MSLWIKHPYITSDEVIDGLGLEPRFFYSAGEPRKGTVREGNEFYETTYVCMPLVSKNYPDLDDEIVTWCAYLESKSVLMTRVIDTGGAAMLHVSVHISDIGGFSIGSRAMGMMHALGIELDVEIYPDADDVVALARIREQS